MAAPVLEGWRPDVLDLWLRRRSYQLAPGELVLRYDSGKFITITPDDMRSGALRALPP